MLFQIISNQQFSIAIKTINIVKLAADFYHK